jgi:hypothetical protein
MPEFLAETYAPAGAPGAAGAAAPRAADIALAADPVSQDRTPVRFLGAIAVPGEETCFYLFESPSAGAVRAAMTRAGLKPDRITPAVSIRPADPAASAGSKTGRRAVT